MSEDGKLRFYGRETKKSIQHITDDYLRKIRQTLGIDKMVFYSARKTFAQISNELMIKDSIIEYCLGDAPSNPRRALNFYIKINRRIADKAIRKVFDAVASDKTLEQLMNEADISGMPIYVVVIPKKKQPASNEPIRLPKQFRILLMYWRKEERNELSKSRRSFGANAEWCCRHLRPLSVRLMPERRQDGASYLSGQQYASSLTDNV